MKLRFKKYIINNVLDVFNSGETERIFESEYSEHNIEFEFALNEESNSSLLAVCSAYIDNTFAIHKIQIIREKNGEISVVLPYVTTITNKIRYICELISNRDEFYEQIVDAYLKISNNNNLSIIKSKLLINENMKDYKVVQNEKKYFEIDIPKGWKVFSRDILNKITEEATEKVAAEPLAFLFETQPGIKMFVSITELGENTFESNYDNSIKKLKEHDIYILSQNIIENKSIYIRNLFVKDIDKSILCHNYFQKDNCFFHIYWKVPENETLKNIINSEEIKAIYSLRKIDYSGIIKRKSEVSVSKKVLVSDVFTESIEKIRDIVNNHKNINEKDLFVLYAKELGCNYEETENGIIFYFTELTKIEYIIESNKVQKIFGTLENGKKYGFERKSFEEKNNADN